MSPGRNPWIAAFLNLVFWGSGYVYIKHRRVLGAGLLFVFFMNLSLLLTIPYSILLYYSELLFIWGMFMWALLSMIFAIDVFYETREIRKYEDMD